jgi:hypothetical protein
MARCNGYITITLSSTVLLVLFVCAHEGSDWGRYSWFMVITTKARHDTTRQDINDLSGQVRNLLNVSKDTLRNALPSTSFPLDSWSPPGSALPSWGSSRGLSKQYPVSGMGCGYFCHVHSPAEGPNGSALSNICGHMALVIYTCLSDEEFENT